MLLLGLLCSALVGLRLVGLSSDSLHLGGRLVYVPVGLIEWEASSGKWKKRWAHPWRYVLICTLLCLGYAGLGCFILTVLAEQVLEQVLVPRSKIHQNPIISHGARC